MGAPPELVSGEKREGLRGAGGVGGSHGRNKAHLVGPKKHRLAPSQGAHFNAPIKAADLIPVLSDDSPDDGSSDANGGGLGLDLEVLRSN